MTTKNSHTVLKEELSRTAFRHKSNCAEPLKCRGNFNSMVQVEAKMFGVSSTLTLTQPGRKAAVVDLHPVTKPSNVHKTSSLALAIKLNNMCVTFFYTRVSGYWQAQQRFDKM